MVEVDDKLWKSKSKTVKNVRMLQLGLKLERMLEL